MNRDLLAAETEGYRKGREELMKEYDLGNAIIRTGAHVYLLSEYAEKERVASYQRGLEEGRIQGIAIGRSRIGRIEWLKLFGVVVMGSAIGCGMILALAVGLSHL